MSQYKFEKKLIEGIIISRPNRFVMYVNIKGKVLRCHCPVPGRIGDIDFENIPCLLSERIDKSKITPYTVEAISINNLGKSKWVGINQTKVNTYIEYLIKNGNFIEILGTVDSIKREIIVGESRIDFLINNTYLEVKTFLTSLPIGEDIKHKNYSKFNSFERILKQYQELINITSINKKSIIVLCFIYDAVRLTNPILETYNEQLIQLVKHALNLGIDHWQVNLLLTEEGVSLDKLYKLNE